MCQGQDGLQAQGAVHVVRRDRAFGRRDHEFNEIFTADEQLSVSAALALNPRSRRIRWQPGTRHAYSNVGYTIAARAIEVASGEPFDVYLRREILAPLGITKATFERTSVLAPRIASGYINSDEPVVFRPFAHQPDGALLASANDLATLVHVWRKRGESYPQVVSARGLARIEQSGTLPYPTRCCEWLMRVGRWASAGPGSCADASPAGSSRSDGVGAPPGVAIADRVT